MEVSHVAIYGPIQEGLFLDDEEKELKEQIKKDLKSISSKKLLKLSSYNAQFAEKVRKTLEKRFDKLYISIVEHTVIYSNYGINESYTQYATGIKDGHLYNFSLNHFGDIAYLMAFGGESPDSRIPLEIYYKAIDICSTFRSTKLALKHHKISFIDLTSQSTAKSIVNEFCDYVNNTYAGRFRAKPNMLTLNVSIIALD